MPANHRFAFHTTGFMLTPLSFIAADPVRDRDRLFELNVEYMAHDFAQIEKLLGVNLPAVLGMSVQDYVASGIDKICGKPPPEGIFYLVESADQLVGMGGIRSVRPGVSEMKRVYVRPAFRGRHFGGAIIQRLLDDAKAFGFMQMVLDSPPFSKSAQRIYEGLGFRDCSAHPETEVPTTLRGHWRYMQRPI